MIAAAASREDVNDATAEAAEDAARLWRLLMNSSLRLVEASCLALIEAAISSFVLVGLASLSANCCVLTDVAEEALLPPVRMVTATADGGEGRKEPAAVAATAEGDSAPDAYDACPLDIDDEIEDCLLVGDTTGGDITGVVVVVVVVGTTGVGGGGTGGETADTVTAAVVFVDARIGARNIGISYLIRMKEC